MLNQPAAQPQRNLNKGFSTRSGESTINQNTGEIRMT